jgi:hypothetical protein
MVMSRFDFAQLIEQLREVVPEARAIFAAACAERLLPAYIAYEAAISKMGAAALRRALSQLWEDLSGSTVQVADIEEAAAQCLGLGPGEEDPGDELQKSLAADSAAAVVFALRCRRTGAADEAAKCANRAYEARYQFLTYDETGRVAITDSEAVAHPVIQAELGRQARDLDELRAVGKGDLPEAAKRCRERAVREAFVLFGGSGKDG